MYFLSLGMGPVKEFLYNDLPIHEKKGEERKDYVYLSK